MSKSTVWPSTSPWLFPGYNGNFVFPDFDDVNMVYFDDIVVFGETYEEFVDNLTKTLDRLIEVGMVCKPGKCKFGTTSLEYSGFIVDEHKYQIKPDRIDAIKKFQKPTTVQQLRRFLGMTNQLRDFCTKTINQTV